MTDKPRQPTPEELEDLFNSLDPDQVTPKYLQETAQAALAKKREMDARKKS